MQINGGKLDRIARIVVGLMLLSVPFRLDSSWRWLGLIGLEPPAQTSVQTSVVHGETGRWPESSLAGPQ